MAAKGFGPEWEQLYQQKGWWHSFELPDGSVIHGVAALEGLKDRVSFMPLPADLHGKSLLDIGAWDGWFTFEMERRGAAVTSIDCVDSPRYHQMHDAYGSGAGYRLMDVYEIAPETVGRFDYVLFLGVLYHLKHPLLGLEKVCSVTTDMAIVESYILQDDVDPEGTPVLTFYESTELEGRPDNWCAPNLACLLAMCRTAGFARVELQRVQPFGACIACYRRWSPGNPAGPACELLGAAHAWNAGLNFDTHKDEYLLAQFRTSEPGLTRRDVQPSVGGYGVYPLSVSLLSQDMWQVNFKLPPGLTAGWHTVEVAVRGGMPHGTTRIAVDLPLKATQPHIEGVCDAATWAPGLLDLSSGRAIALWCSGVPENADAANTAVLVNGAPCTLDIPLSVEPVRQINAILRDPPPAGRAEVRLRIGGHESEPAYIEITGSLASA